eukprot:Pompholyxophrys_sp_v1_NODE_74_length_2407_cov_37.196003.p1 type:complete len:414 gc:universal NODE_74_length_2407_cov_37.196003:1297-56(-)
MNTSGSTYPSTRTLRRQRKEAEEREGLSTNAEYNNNNIVNEEDDNNRNEEDGDVMFTNDDEDGGDVLFANNEEDGGDVLFASNDEDVDGLCHKLDDQQMALFKEEVKAVRDNHDELYLLILIYAFRYNLSNAAISGMLIVLEFAMTETDFHSSLYFLRKHFQPSHAYTLSHFCNHCSSPLPTDKHVCTTDLCPAKEKSNVGMFSIMDLKDLIQTKLLRPSFVELRKYKTERHKQQADNLEDIMDGQKWVRNKNTYDRDESIVVGLNADGVPLFKSSNLSMWAVWMVYYDIPPSQRYKHHNMSLLPVSFGRRPIMNTFFGPIVDAINDSEVHLFMLNVCDQQKPFSVHCINVSADLPAPHGDSAEFVAGGTPATPPHNQAYTPAPHSPAHNTSDVTYADDPTTLLPTTPQQQTV